MDINIDIKKLYNLCLNSTDIEISGDEIEFLLFNINDEKSCGIYYCDKDEEVKIAFTDDVCSVAFNLNSLNDYYKGFRKLFEIHAKGEAS